MSLVTLVAAWPLLAAGVAPLEPPATEEAPSAVIELGLTSPLETLEDVESFSHDLEERLVWRIHGGNRYEAADVRVRFTAVRIDRGRITASFQSELHDTSHGLARIAGVIGSGEFDNAFPDVCLSPDDPPAAVRALSGSSHFDSEGLERAIADAARTRDVGTAFGIDETLDVEWGRHVLLILAASTENPAVRIRPLLLVLERR